MAHQRKNSVSATITAQNVFSEYIHVTVGDRVSISAQPGAGTTVTLQRMLDGINWRDVESWTVDVESTYVADESCDIRLGVKTGDYGASTTVRLGRD